MASVEIFFQRHGVSLWNRRAGTAWYPSVMEEFGIGKASAEEHGIDPQVWTKAMEASLSSCANGLMRDDPDSSPPDELKALDPLLVDPPLTLEGKRGLRKAGAAAQKALNPRPFTVCIVSPMLRTLQTAAIAGTFLPFDKTCKWIIDADAREHNHKGWIDTWGTAASASLRKLADEEIKAAGCCAESRACAVRAPLQQRAIESAIEGPLKIQAEKLRNHEKGIAGFCAAVNAPVVASPEDAAAAEAEADFWSHVQGSSPEFKYREAGDPDGPQLCAQYKDDFTCRWWLLEETEEAVRGRVQKLLASEAVSEAEGPVFIVTHSMLIREAMNLLLTEATAWTGPADKCGDKDLVSNGAIFRVVLDRSTGVCLEAGLFMP